jgi:hypothetical protein
MGAGGECRLKELEALGDLTGRVNVERRAIALSESVEADVIAVKDTIAVDKGAGGYGRCGCGDLLFQNGNALSFLVASGCVGSSWQYG